MEKIDMPVFSNDDNKKMLAAIKECISLVKGCEPENEELWKFCKVFILLPKQSRRAKCKAINEGSRNLYLEYSNL